MAVNRATGSTARGSKRDHECFQFPRHINPSVSRAGESLRLCSRDEYASGYVGLIIVVEEPSSRVAERLCCLARFWGTAEGASSELVVRTIVLMSSYIKGSGKDLTCGLLNPSSMR